MPVDKLTIEQFAQKVKAKYPQYKDVNDSVLVEKMVAKYPEYKSQINYSTPSATTQSGFKPTTDWLAIPQGYQPMVTGNAVNDHNARVDSSRDRVKAHLSDIDESVHDLIYNKKKDLQGRIVSEQLGINPREIGPFNVQAQQLEGQMRQDVPVTPEEIEGFKTDMNSNQVMARQALSQKAEKLTKTDPLASKQLKADIYRLDRQNDPAKEDKISKNVDKIHEGEYDYDIVRGQLIKPEGFFGSLVTGYKDKVQAFDDAGIYESGDEKAILERIKERLRHDPDKALPVSEQGWLKHPLAEMGRMTGGQPLKPLIGGGAAGLLLGPEAGAAASGLISIPEMYRLTLGSALPQNYDAIKKQNPNLSDSDALKNALELTHKQAAVDAASGGAMAAFGARAGFAPTGLKTGLLQKSLGSALKQIGQEGVKKTIEGLGIGSIGATGQYVKNLMAKKAGIPVDTSEGLAQQLWGGVGMTMAMTMIAKAPELLKPKTYSQLLQAVKDVPKEEVQAHLNELEQSGEITPEQSKSAENAIQEHQALDNSIKPEVPESDRIKAQELIKKRNELEDSLESTDKAYHAEIKEEIKSLNEQIVNVSKGAERGDLQKLVDAEHKAGNIEGFVTGVLRDASEGDLKKYFKEISDQVRDGNEEMAIQTFGKNIVDKAKELNPAKMSDADLAEYNNRLREKTSGINLNAAKQPENNNILFRPDRAYRAIGSGGYQDFLDNGLIRANPNGKNQYEIDYFSKGSTESRYAKGDRGRYIVEAVRDDRWTTAPNGYEAAPKGLGKGDKIRIFEQKEDGSYKVVYDNIGDEAFYNKPKKSTVSVIKPGEIRQPETITIKSIENAIPVGSTEEVHVGQASGDSQPVGEGIPESGEAASAQETGIPGQESTPTGQEGIGEPPSSNPRGYGVFVEHPETQLSFRGLQDTANEFGFEDVRSRDRVTDLQERKNAETTVNEWASKGEYQKNIDDLLNKIEAREHIPLAKQRLILEQYLANEKQKLRELPKSSNEYDAQLQKVKRIKDIGQIARQETGAALRLPNGGSLPHPILDEADAMAAKMEANAVDKLTDQQKAEVEAQVEKYKQRDEEAKLKIAELEAQVAKADAQKELNKTKSTTKKTKKTAEERAEYRKSQIEAAREALRKLRSGESGLGSVPLPGVRELIAIAPHVKNIMVDLVAQGVDNLQDVVKHLHTEFKDVLEGITEKNIHDIIAGEYNEKARPLSELRKQLNDIRDEAKYINQYEALVNGKEPKSEGAKRERNRKIKEIKDKIKSLKQDIKDSEKFYGESDSGEKKLDELRDELERIQDRRQKEKPAKDSQAEKEISAREQELRDQIKEAQAEWDREKESGKQRDRDYARMEFERNRQMQRVSDLKEKLDNLQNGVKSKGKSVVKKVDTPEIEALKQQVSDAEKELNKTLATEKRVKGLEEELDRLKQRKEKEPKEENKRDISEREAELKKQIDEERKAFNKEKSEASKFYKEELDDDAKKLIAIKKRNQKLEQQIRQKIANGQFEKEVRTSIFDREDVKKNYPRLRKDALDAVAKKEDAQHEFDLSLFKDEMARRKWYEKAGDFGGKLFHTFKAVKAGIDDSATFVQLGMAMLSNPDIGAKTWVQHWKEAFSEPAFKRQLAAIHADPDFDIMQKSKLDIVEPHSAASKQVEEAFEKNLLAGKIKINGKDYQPWKYTGGIFERAFTSMGNNFRVKLFKESIQMLRDEGKTFESHPKEYEDAARAINELTGRGKLPNGLAQASPYITPFIWAPRLLTSTINTLGLSDVAYSLVGKGKKGYYRSLTPMQRKFALHQMENGISMGVAVMGAAAIGGAKVDYDPRSVTFGDVVIGNHHYNVFGRYVPVVKTIVQAVGGIRLKDGQPQDLDSDNPRARTRMGVVGGFLRGKMTPAAGALYDLAQHKNYYTQEPFGVKDLPDALITPLSAGDLMSGWQKDGTWTILNRFLPAFEGVKVSDERDFQKSNSSSGSSSHKNAGHKNTHISHKHN